MGHQTRIFSGEHLNLLLGLVGRHHEDPEASQNRRYSCQGAIQIGPRSAGGQEG